MNISFSGIDDNGINQQKNTQINHLKGMDGALDSSAMDMFNLGLRALMEVGIIVALGYWGYKTGDSAPLKILLSIGAPLVGFGFWSLVDFRQAGSLAETLRLLQELVISGSAAMAWYITGAETMGWILGGISLIHLVLIYALGARLLKR